MKTTGALVLLSAFVTALLTSCSRAPEVPFAPEIPARGAPVLFSYDEYDIKRWKALSQTNFPWFAERPNGWYIDWHCERQPIDTLVVHHSAGSGRETPEEISETVYRQVYGGDEKFYSVYRDQKYREPYVSGLPIHSGHVVNGQETYTAYHYLVYPDGSMLTTLVPHHEVNGKLMVDMIGWGAGNWKVNCSSVQVCLLGTYAKDKPPTKNALMALASVVRYYRDRVPDLRVVSHDEVRTAGPKNCPGGWFEEWRDALK